MGLPDSTGPHDGQVPDDNKAIGIAGQESLVLAAKHSRMDLCLVPSQDGLGLRRAAVGCHCVYARKGSGFDPRALPNAGRGKTALETAQESERPSITRRLLTGNFGEAAAGLGGGGNLCQETNGLRVQSSE